VTDPLDLRAQLIREFDGLPSEFVHPNEFGGYDVDNAAAADIALAVVEPVLSGLRADLDQARGSVENLTGDFRRVREQRNEARAQLANSVTLNQRLEDDNASLLADRDRERSSRQDWALEAMRLQVERHALLLMLRGMARKVAAYRRELRYADNLVPARARVIGEHKATIGSLCSKLAESARRGAALQSSLDATLSTLSGVRVEHHELRAEHDRVLAENRRLVSANRALRGSVRWLERDVAFLQKRNLTDAAAHLAADFRQRAEQSIASFDDGEEFVDECDSPAECHASAQHFTWRLAAQALERLLAVAPAAVPVPVDPARELDDGPDEDPFLIVAHPYVATELCHECGQNRAAHSRVAVPVPVDESATVEHLVTLSSDESGWQAFCSGCKARHRGTGSEVEDWADQHTAAATVVEVDADSELGRRMARDGAHSGIDTPDCDCGHQGMGRVWHASGCDWVRIWLDAEADTPDARRDEPGLTALRAKLRDECSATEGATGVDCELAPGHDSWHGGSHTPRTDATKSVGYPFAIQWSRNEYDGPRVAPQASSTPTPVDSVTRHQARAARAKADRVAGTTYTDKETGR
jgi:hypothetical protein